MNRPDDDVLPAVPPADFTKTRAAINDITGVHTMAEMMRAMVKSGGAGGNFGGGTSGDGVVDCSLYNHGRGTDGS